VPFDRTGKVSFDTIYTQPDPRAFFTTLRELDYQIPQLAKPHFTALIDEYRARRAVANPTVLDLGCSYGVNAVLLRCDATMSELYEHYAGAGSLDRDRLLAWDRELIRTRARGDGVRFTGLDSSEPALRYAMSAGFLDDAVHADLERDEPTEQQRARLARVDLVVSTGCLGYVTEKTLVKIVEIASERRPWMAHFVLRMFSYAAVAESLAGLGYETTTIGGVFKQRKFASRQEQELIMDTLSAAGVDPEGTESDGWLYAQLYVSRPR
jgi:SAM-dependent methyltransferase